MAATKLSELPEKEIPTTSDVILITDVADGADSKKVLLNNLPVQSSVVSALSAKLEASDIANFETSTQLNSRDTANRDRANHSGSQAISTVTNLQTNLDAKIAKNIGSTYTTNAITTVTQAEYDAIPTKDANTLYFII